MNPYWEQMLFYQTVILECYQHILEKSLYTNSRILYNYVAQYLLYNNQMERVTYSYTRQHLNTILDQIADNTEVFCIHRKNGKEVVMLEKDHYDSLVETAYLLRSPKNAQELFKALAESKQNIGKKVEF
ncbi:type II toxin-antitoxin system Phd/YefM family antitoxin [Rickettsia endosymbiont of Oedothorax gibbosus]|uniref:type II toxin-antitoxin system Phd/YefM family antitoxin n=1 Tax=Rickettsia endosymbiont of Oedothorax gibbosus TaxID=931099 RepID=UPI002024AEC9|nr:type II toxin-antitoxin system Phd/YefM family antitoxin [Rickettsia endosymbiont of Oedothorax gibbosus]